MIKTPKILVVGSLVMDTIVTTRRFPKAGETILGLDFASAPGGKGANQAVQMARLGAQVDMLGCVGEDDYGNALIASLKDSGVDVTHVMRRKECTTAVASIQIEQREDGSSQNRIIVVPGANMAITEEDVSFLKESVRNYDMVVLQLEIPMYINELVAEYAKAAGVPVMLNPAPMDKLSDSILNNVTYLSPNEVELAALLGKESYRNNDSIDLEQVEGDIREHLMGKVAKLLVTLGDCGSMLVHEKETVVCPAFDGIIAVDPTAAGDSFVSSFCVGISSGMTELEAMRYSSAAAAITVSRYGAQPSLPYKNDVNAFLAERRE